MRTTLLCLLGLLFFACQQDPSSRLLEPSEHEWAFDLENRVDTTKHHEVLNPGDRLVIKGDTLVVKNDYESWSSKFPLYEREAVSDSTLGFVLEAQPDSTLRVSRYFQDSLRGQWNFVLAQEGRPEISEGGLTGKTFRFKFPDSDSLQVYIGYDEKVAYGREVKEYFVSSRSHTFVPKTKVSSGDIYLWFNSPFAPAPLRGGQFYFPSGNRKTGFNRYRYKFEQEPDGQVVVTYLRRTKDRYVLSEMPLNPVPSIIPPTVSVAVFAERISTGKVIVDQSYPRVDSAKVKYSYTEDYYKHDGLDPVDLDYLEFSFNPEGEYFILARDRLIMSGNWELSPDRNYVVTLTKEGGKFLHFPILAYTDEFIEFRLPLKVKTREPRGVKLESYCILDAFVRVEVRK